MFRLATMIALFLITVTLRAQDKQYFVKCSFSPLYVLEGSYNAMFRSDDTIFVDSANAKVGDYGELSEYIETHLFAKPTGVWTPIGIYEITGAGEGFVSVRMVRLYEMDLITFGFYLANKAPQRQARFAHYNYGQPQPDTVLWENGKRKEIGRAICGTKVGMREYYDETGKLVEEYSTDEEGRKDGLYTSYYTNGMKRSCGNYVKDLMDSVWMNWYDSGIKQSIITYQDGKYDGPCATFHPNGVRATKANFDNDKVMGPDSSWYDSGLLKSCGWYRLGEPRDLHLAWHDNGTLEFRHPYDHWTDKRNGLWQEWYSNGQMAYECEFVKGDAHGRCTEWYSNGKKKKEAFYVNGELTDDYRTYFENGRTDTSGSYVNGLQDGKWNCYYPNGKKKWSGSYSRGDTTGTWKWWTENGKVSDKKNYTN